MIAYVLRETGRDPAWLIGAPVPQLGSNAGFGAGQLVVEADESDRTVFALAPEIAVVTNLELDHHTRVRVRRRARGRVRPLACVRAARRARRACLRRRARAARRAQPAERRRGARRARAARRDARGGGAGVRALLGHGPPLRGARARRPHARRRLRPPSDRGRRSDRRRARAVPRAPACACSSSRTSTRARATSRPSSPPRSRPPTT